MNSPTRQHDKQQQQSQTGELSPVLTRKRFSRRTSNRKPYNRPTESSPIKTRSKSKSPSQSQSKSPNSHIPVPVKSVKTVDVKKAVQSTSKVQSDIKSASSSSLSNFKQQVIKNCAKTAVISPKKSAQGNSSNPFSISEGSIKSRTFFVENKTESDSKVVQPNKGNDRSKYEKSNDFCAKFQTTEARCASGDNSEDDSSQNFLKPRHVAKIPKKDLDMLYENTKFEGGSKTTLESDASPSPSPSSKESVSSPKKIPRRQSFSQIAPECIKEEDTDKEIDNSQLNYGESIDDVDVDSAQHKNSSRECKNKVKSSFLTKNVSPAAHQRDEKCVENIVLSPTLQREIQNWVEEDSYEKQKAFYGFSQEEIDFVEKKYKKCKEYLRLIGQRKKKVRKTSDSDQIQNQLQGKTISKCNANNKMADGKIHRSPETKKLPNEIVINDEKQTGANNRVQICIGNNRIQINIKADKKSPTENDSQSTSKAIDLPSGSKSDQNKSQSHGFWSFSTDDSKNDNSEKNKFDVDSCDLNLNNIDIESECNESKIREIEEFSSSGFKSASGHEIPMNREALKRAEKLLDEDNKLDGGFDKFNQSSSCVASGFISAGSGRPIKLSSSMLQKASKLFDDLDLNGSETSRPEVTETATVCSTPTTRLSNDVTKISSGEDNNCSSRPVQERKILKARSLLGKQRLDNKSYNNSENFRKSLFSEDSIQTDADVVEFGKVESFNFEFTPGFSTASGKQIMLSPEKLKKAAKKFDDFETPTTSTFCGFTSAAGKKIEISKEKMEEAARKFQDCDVTNDMNFSEVQTEKLENSASGCSFGGFTSAGGKKLIVDPDKLKAAAAKFDDLDYSEAPSTSSTKTAHELIEDVCQTYDKALERLNSSKEIKNVDSFKTPGKSLKFLDQNASPLTTGNSLGKKRLGMTGLPKTYSIPKEKLEKARMMFEECDKDLSITPMKSFAPNSFKTPVRQSVKASTSTIVREQLMTSTPFAQRGNNFNTRLNDISNFTLDVTPIKTLSNEKTLPKRRTSQNYDSDEDYDGILIFREKSCTNLQELHNDVEREYLQLKKKLEILGERKTALENQRLLIDQCDYEHTRPRPGILTIKKKQNRVKLIDLPTIIADIRDLRNCYDIDARMQEITARNADKIHFKSTKTDKPVIYSLDGGRVIPNTHNTIGVTEINNAFQAMAGVEPKLIPKGWVANHYKWIVWKLASYERRFPEGFRNYLSVDNIMQQLKYRYDREIDGANRPAIRRILERDDVSNKRIVLCVADIIQICSNKFELILTDGWYPIRTVIDNLLSQQIYNGKIAVGTKLMIQGAELMDCEGYHPLDVPDHVKLKIGYNNTRRALWHVRLGYYPIPTPFPIRLQTIHPDGGPVACVKVFVVRVYPLRFMEEYKGVKVWRNAKAEEKRAADFEAESFRQFEKIKEEVYAEYESCLKNTVNKKMDRKQLMAVTCPKELYSLLEASNDPDSFYNLLNLPQRTALMEYRVNSMADRQKDLARRVAERVDEMNTSKRILTPLLKVLVCDALEENAKCMVLNVWNPSEEQIQLLQEESCYTICNLGVKRTCELNTGRRTMFQSHEGVTSKRCQRILLPIALTTDPYHKPLFNEFDTLGVIVELTIREFDQEIWLADFSGRLLYVKILDGPKLCSLLDTNKLGQCIACCNLIMHLPHSEFGQSVANQYSTITQFPHQKYLQQGLELFVSRLSDVEKLIGDCKRRIEKLRAHVNLKSTNSYPDYTLLHKSKPNLFEDALDENETIPSRLTMMDVAMSMIDTDKLM